VGRATNESDHRSSWAESRQERMCKCAANLSLPYDIVWFCNDFFTLDIVMTNDVQMSGACVRVWETLSFFFLLRVFATATSTMRFNVFKLISSFLEQPTEVLLLHFRRTQIDDKHFIES
jgi:hypothetical protein